jgi:malate synthase
MTAPADPAIVVESIDVPGADEVLTPDALAFVGDLQRRFGGERIALLEARRDRQKELDAGIAPDFLAATADVRAAQWTVAPAPADLDDRRVEITGPAEPKMMIARPIA